MSKQRVCLQKNRNKRTLVLWSGKRQFELLGDVMRKDCLENSTLAGYVLKQEKKKKATAITEV